MGKDKYNGFVTVFISGDLGVLAIAKSILESEGIKYSVSGEIFQSILGVGVQGGIFGNKGTAAQIQVMPEDAEIATELLAELSTPE